LLIGNKINLRPTEREDVPLLTKWMNDPDFVGQFFLPVMRPQEAFEKHFGDPQPDSARYIIETKDGKPAGWIMHFMTRFGGYVSTKEIGYMLAPEHRQKGYCTEAIAMVVDYLFLGKTLERIQALITEENIGSKRALEKNGFQKEGILRKLMFELGRYWDLSIYSILREEWKKPKVLSYAVK